jgi:hypothetical protein
VKGEGTALRLSTLRASERREVRKAALNLGDALFASLDAIDDLLGFGEPSLDFPDGAKVLTDSEKVALGHARTNVLSAFHALKVGAPDLCGLVPTEAMGEQS